MADLWSKISRTCVSYSNNHKKSVKGTVHWLKRPCCYSRISEKKDTLVKHEFTHLPFLLSVLLIAFPILRNWPSNVCWGVLISRFLCSSHCFLPNHYRTCVDRQEEPVRDLRDHESHHSIVHKRILNTSLVEANYKVLSRWYLVLKRLAKIYLNASPVCFRVCGQEGTMLHIWWTCLKVKRFWIRIFNLVYSVTRLNIRKNIKIIIIFWSISGSSLFFIFLAAKTTIARA